MSAASSTAELVLKQLAEAAVRAVQPDRCIPQYLPEPPANRAVVVGGGKASAAMARALEAHWTGAELSGVVTTRYGHALPCEHIEIIEASHPVPDIEGVRAAKRMMAIAEALTADDLLIVLMSGGASALLPLPAGNITLEEKQSLTRALLESGATIAEINRVRRQISAIKGGRLAQAAAPARVVTLAISDVVGNDPSAIGSGPTVPDQTTASDAIEVLNRYGVDTPPAVLDWLQRDIVPVQQPISEYHLIATPDDALSAAQRAAEALGLEVVNLGDAIEGEARLVGAAHAELARRHTRDGLLILSGGELTVTIEGNGKGGPNTEYLLGLALRLASAPDIYALAMDTDGTDGSEQNAGAWITPQSLALGGDAHKHLRNNDAYSFFEDTGKLYTTGPTQTNVNDFRAILIASPERLRQLKPST